jgi:hypothetical protein
MKPQDKETRMIRMSANETNETYSLNSLSFAYFEVYK